MILDEEIRKIDGGRFEKLADAITFKDVCLKCVTFNQTLVRDPRQAYRCAVEGSCPGVTLSSEIISYLLWKIGVKTESEHIRWIGL